MRTNETPGASVRAGSASKNSAVARPSACRASGARAQVAITDYPYAPATEEALVIMGQAYERLGLNDLAGDSRRVLQKNFPNSAALSPAQPRPWWKLW